MCVPESMYVHHMHARKGIRPLTSEIVEVVSHRIDAKN